MKAFDANLDRSACDNGFDQQASRNLSRDVDQTIRNQFSERQRLSVASNYFALACPIMPVGLLGAFFMLDKLGSLSEEQQLTGKTHAQDLVKERSQVAQEVYLAAIKQKQESNSEKRLACSRPVDLLVSPGDRKTTRKPPREASVLFGGKRTERLGGPQAIAKSKGDELGKLIKEKAALEKHLEKISQLQDYHGACRVSAQIELLEKALKKLGA